MGLQPTPAETNEIAPATNTGPLYLVGHCATNSEDEENTTKISDMKRFEGWLAEGRACGVQTLTNPYSEIMSGCAVA